jgi:hypothetical protein
LVLVQLSTQDEPPLLLEVFPLELPEELPPELLEEVPPHCDERMASSHTETSSRETVFDRSVSSLFRRSGLSATMPT